MVVLAAYAAQKRKQNQAQAEWDRGIAKFGETVGDLKKRMDAAKGALDLAKSEGITVSKGRIEVPEQLLFPVAEADLTERGKKIVRDGIAPAILKALAASAKSGSPNVRLLIEGHTDSVKIEKPPLYPTNWELSARRATNFLREILGARPMDIDPRRLFAAGFADTKPAVENKDAEPKNRRVEVSVYIDVGDLLEALPDAPSPPPKDGKQ